MRRARQHRGTAVDFGPTSDAPRPVAPSSTLPMAAARCRRARPPISKLAICSVAVLVLATGAAMPQPSFDCGKAYKDFWEKLEREIYSKMPPEQLVILSRRALRIYDACQTGDVEDPKGLFERLVRLTK
jgi:hypothetical protein